MSAIAGIDLSTVALDLVLIDEDGGQPRAYTYELGAGDIVERIRTIGTTWPSRHSSIWDDVLAIGIERPAGRFGVAQVSMAFGAVLAMPPTDRVVKPWQPSEWRIALGLKPRGRVEMIREMQATDGLSPRDRAERRRRRKAAGITMKGAPRRPLCKGTTKRGARCAPASTESGYCWIHDRERLERAA